MSRNQKKDKVLKESKLSDGETERIQGWMARVAVARSQTRKVEIDAEGVISAIAGEGYSLQQKDDGVWRIPAPKE